MILYIGIAIAVFSLFSIQFYSNKRSRNLKVLFLVVFLVFAIVYSLRKGVGTDFKSYQTYYEHITSPSYVNSFSFEKGFYYLNLIFNKIGLSFWTFYFFVNFFSSVLFCVGLNGIVKNKPLAILISTFFFFYPGIESVRQSISLSLFVFSFRYLNKKRYFFFILNIIGFMFHRAAIITFVFFFFHKYKVFRYIIVAIIVFFSSFQSYIEKLFQLIPSIYAKYQWYFVYTMNFETSDSVTSFKNIEYIILLSIFFIMIVYNKMHKRMNIPNNETLVLAKNLLFLGTLIQLFFVKYMAYSYRFAFFTDIGIILAYEYIGSKVVKKNKIIYIFVLALYIGFRFYRIISANPSLFFLK